ncbi:helix-turn-helix transcriptional regulator [Cnuibacter physcomitrellae]|uniref:helix-turn-helix transcriptional regulator n=1 Tax=Cnuibacter physcomitrellae TaxID=1619308 RepID=UPI0021760599|nr:helix-turn-helix transcriptional regulator [Cnuibacter physcomitrellae]MCS5495872.1 helix-turn-helix transcriptional regulator [Cnuibacter physcomitrellae]
MSAADERAVEVVRAAASSGLAVVLVGRSEAGSALIVREALADGTSAPGRIASYQREVSIPPRLRGLEREGSLRVVRLGPLTPSQTLAVVERELGGPLQEDSVPHVIPKRPVIDLDLLLRVVADLRQSDILRRQADGSWRADPVPSIPPYVRSRILSFDVTDDRAGAWEWAIDLLATCPELEANTAIGLLDDLGVDGAEAAFEELEAVGRIEATVHGGRLDLSLSDGTHELLLPRTVGAMRRRRIERALVPRLRAHDPGALSRGETLYFAAHEEFEPTPGDPRLFMAAARASLRTADRAASLRLARRAVTAGGGIEAELVLAAAEIQHRMLGDARKRLLGLIPRAEDDAQRSAAVVTLLQLTYDSHGDPAGLDLIPEQSTDDARGRLILRGLLLHALGDLAGAGPLVEQGITGLTGAALAQAHYVVGTAALMACRLADARRHLDEAERILEQVGGDPSRVHFARADVDFFEGRARRSISTLRAFMGSGPAFHDPAVQGLCGWALGSEMLMVESASRAVGELEDAVRNLESAGVTRTALVARTDLAIALAVTGRAQDGHLVLLESELAVGDPSTTAPLLASKLVQAQGWLAAAEGDRGAATRMLIEAAEAYERDDLVIGSLVARMEAARCGAALAQLPWVRRTAAALEGAFPRLALHFVEALAAAESGDDALAGERGEAEPDTPAALEAVAEEALAIDLHLYAAEAFGRAALAYSARGREREAAAAARRRDEQMRWCGIERLVLVPEQRVRVLSVREAEIADLAAAGMTNREISSTLVLSVRTVETHLLRVYQKLGIRRRSELAEALKGALRTSVEDA